MKLSFFKINMLISIIFSCCTKENSGNIFNENSTGNNIPNFQPSAFNKIAFSQSLLSNDIQNTFSKQAIVLRRSKTFTWTITNKSNTPSTPLSFSSNSAGEVIINEEKSTCAKVNQILAPGSSCFFKFSYTPPIPKILPTTNTQTSTDDLTLFYVDEKNNNKITNQINFKIYPFNYNIPADTEKFSNYLNNSNITSIAIDSAGIIYVGTQNGLSILKKDSTKTIGYNITNITGTELPGSGVNQVVVNSKDVIYVATNNGLSILNKDSTKYSGYNITNVVNNNKNPFNVYIKTICVDSDGSIYAGTMGNGLYIFTKDPTTPSGYNITNIINISNSTTNNQAAKVNVNQIINPNILDNNINKVSFDATRNLVYVATNSGLTVVKKAPNTQNAYNVFPFTIDYPYISNYTQMVAVDPNGVVYLNTGSGFLILEQKYFAENVQYKTVKNPPLYQNFSSVSGVAVDFQGVTYLAKEYAGFCILDITQQNGCATSTNMSGASISNNLTSIAVSPDGTIYVGGSNLYVLNKDLTKANGYNVSQIPAKPTQAFNSNINSLLVDSDDTIYAGTNDDGLAIIKKDEIENRNFTAIYKNVSTGGLSSNNIRSIKMDSSGVIYLGTPNGISILKKDPLGEYDFNIINFSLFPSEDIKNINIDSKDVIYIGTNGGGLSILQKTVQGTYNINSIDTTTGLANNTINSIVIDSNDVVYVGTESNNLSILKKAVEGGYNINNVNTGLTNIKTLGIDSTGVIYAGSDNGMAVIQKNPGNTIKYSATAIAKAPFNSTYIKNISVDSDDTVYVSIPGKLYILKKDPTASPLDYKISFFETDMTSNNIYIDKYSHHYFYNYNLYSF